MKYYIAVYQKLRDIYMSQSSLENDIPLICPSLIMYENEDLELLKPSFQITDQLKKTEAILKKQDASYQLNSVPISNQFWDINPSNSLFTIYREILNNLGIKGMENRVTELASESTSLLKDNKGKDSPIYKIYLRLLQAYEAKIEAITEHLTLFDDLQTDEEKKNWNEKLEILQKEKQIALLELEVKGSKKKIEKAMDEVNNVSDLDQYVSMVSSVKNEFDAAEKTDILTLNSLHNLGFIPYDFMDNETGWTTLKLNKAELDAIYDALKKNNGEILPELISIDYDEKFIEGIELDYQFIHLKRNWFNKGVFNSPFFSNKGSKPISDGDEISNRFMLPAYPKTMILIKNLKINLIDSISESQINDPNQLINFGPLILKPQLFVNKNTQQKFLKTITNKNTIKSDQLYYKMRKASFDTVTNKEPINLTKPITETPIGMAKSNLHAFSASSIKASPVFAASTLATQPIKPTVILPIKPVFYNPGLFTEITTVVQPPVTTKTTFSFIDSINKNGVYKCNVSISGTDNKNFFEKETDENGKFLVDLPVGNYRFETRVNGYKVLEDTFQIVNQNPIIITRPLERENVKFASYYLIGMICEKLPKTN